MKTQETKTTTPEKSDWQKAKSLLAELEQGDSNFGLDTIPTERLNAGDKKKKPSKKDWCVTCDAPRDVCDQCDAMDCYICDAPNDTECQTSKDKCQWCTMKDPGAPADAG